MFNFSIPWSNKREKTSFSCCRTIWVHSPSLTGIGEHVPQRVERKSEKEGGSQSLYQLTGKGGGGTPDDAKPIPTHVFLFTLPFPLMGVKQANSGKLKHENILYFVYQTLVSILGQIQKFKIEKKGIAVDDLAKLYSMVHSQADLAWPGGLKLTD
jgi:hypothetical protein